MDMNKIGKFIAEKRKALGYTQDELGELLSLSGKAVSKWERGISFPDISNINSLAVLLKTSVISIMEGGETSVAQSSYFSGSNEKQDSEDAAFSKHLKPVFTETETVVSPYLFGSNMEHTRSNIFFGLSAQMLKNRKFAGKPAAASGHAVEWYPIGERTYYSLVKRKNEWEGFTEYESYTRHDEAHYHMHREHECNAQNMINFHGGEIAGIGQHEIYLQKDKPYTAAVVIKADRPIELTFSLTSRFGKETYSQTAVTVEAQDWTRYEVQLTPSADDPDGDIRITFAEEANIYLGAASLMPSENFRGMRLEVIEELKAMGLKLLRWPGGNFAGEYNWFDGLLPVDMRAPFQSYMWIETQPHSMGYDYHEINTDDFVALCKEIGAQPFITINPAWNTPEESAMWVEYCNGDETTEYGRLRMERGYEEPYNVQFWSLGNEFGYGHMEGDNTPYGYQKIARQHAEAMLKVCKTISFCSSGPYPDRDWATHAAASLSDISPLVSLHYYAPQRDFGDLKQDYLNCISSVRTARNKVHRLRAQLNDNLRISFDEWNTWYAWYRPSCVTDGIFSGLMLHMIIEEAQKSGIAVACHFEAVNEGAIEVSPVGARLTATGQAFQAMKHHINGKICHASDALVATVKDKVMTVTVVNGSYDDELTAELPVTGKLICGELYHGKEIYPHSYFELTQADVKGNVITVPAHSIAFIQYEAE